MLPRSIPAALLLLLAPPLASAQTPRPTELAKPTAASRVRFTEVGGLVELGNGKVLVADPAEQTFVLLDLASGGATPVARRGSGPREYRGLGQLIRRADGGAMLVDFAQFRLLPIGPDGSVGDVVPYPRELGRSVAWNDGQGRFYGAVFRRLAGGRGLSDTMLIVRWDPRQGGVDTVGAFDGGVSKWTGGRDQALEAVPAVDMWVVLPTGEVVILDATRYRFQVLGGASQARTVQLPWHPVPFTDADRRAHEQYMAAHPPRPMGSAPSGGSPPELKFSYPKTYPAFVRDHVWLDLTGRLWVETSRSAADPVAVLDVIDRTGSLVGKVALPPRASLAGFGKGVVYVAVPNEDDEIVIQRHPMPSFRGG